MAITLAEAKVGMADKVEQTVVDMFRRSSLLLDELTFDNAISPATGGSTLTYGYVQLLTPSTAAVRAINSEYTAGEAKRVKKTTNAIIMGGSFEVDRVLQNTSGAIDELAWQAEQKVKATSNYFHYCAINGTSAASGAGYETNTFDGLKKLLAGTQNAFVSDLDISTSAYLDSKYNQLLDEVDTLIASIDGDASMLMMNRKMLIKIRAAARRAGYYERTEDAFGRVVETFGGVPMVDLGKYYNGSASVDVVGNGEIYAVSIGLDGFHGISPVGTGIVNTYMPDLGTSGAVKKGEVELVAGVALKNTLKAGVITGITVGEDVSG